MRLRCPEPLLEETRNGEVPVTRAYLMSASPGVTNVTPLTTLAPLPRCGGELYQSGAWCRSSGALCRPERAELAEGLCARR